METKEVIATPANYLDLLDSKTAKEVLDLVADLHGELRLHGGYAGDVAELYWCEKPWKYPEFWIPALNNDWENLGNLDLVAE